MDDRMEALWLQREWSRSAPLLSKRSRLPEFRGSVLISDLIQAVLASRAAEQQLRRSAEDLFTGGFQSTCPTKQLMKFGRRAATICRHQQLHHSDNFAGSPRPHTPRSRNCQGKCYVHNETTLCNTWSRYPCVENKDEEGFFVFGMK